MSEGMATSQSLESGHLGENAVKKILAIDKSVVLVQASLTKLDLRLDKMETCINHTSNVVSALNQNVTDFKEQLTGVSGNNGRLGKLEQKQEELERKYSYQKGVNHGRMAVISGAVLVGWEIIKVAIEHLDKLIAR